jgi:hypothetical protein
MQGLCSFRFPARHLGGNLSIATLITFSRNSWKSRLHRHPGIVSMSTNKPKIVAQFLDEIEAASESWGPQRMTRGRRDVVTAFVRRPSDSSVLLVKRSEKVNTYKLHWGGVSGVVEGNENLQERAKQEVSRLNYFFSL